MDKKITEDMSFDELAEIAKEALSAIYCKLRTNNGFGYNQHCAVTSIGSEPYDVDIVFVDDCICEGFDYASIFKC